MLFWLLPYRTLYKVFLQFLNSAFELVTNWRACTHKHRNQCQTRFSRTKMRQYHTSRGPESKLICRIRPPILFNRKLSFGKVINNGAEDFCLTFFKGLWLTKALPVPSLRFFFIYARKTKQFIVCKFLGLGRIRIRFNKILEPDQGWESF